MWTLLSGARGRLVPPRARRSGGPWTPPHLRAGEGLRAVPAACPRPPRVGCPRSDTSNGPSTRNSRVSVDRPCGPILRSLKRPQAQLQGLLKRTGRMLGRGRSRTGGDVSITRGLRWVFVAGGCCRPSPRRRATGERDPPSDPSADRPSTVVVSVRDGGFHWADAGVGAAAVLATTLLALGLVLTVRPDRGGQEPHEALAERGRRWSPCTGRGPDGSSRSALGWRC